MEENTNPIPKFSRVKNFLKLFDFLKINGRKTLKDLDRYVRFSIAIAIIFTVAILIIFVLTQQEPSTLIQCFFAMFGGEVFFCAMIKLFKLHTEAKIQQGGDPDGYDSDDSSCEQG